MVISRTLFRSMCYSRHKFSTQSCRYSTESGRTVKLSYTTVQKGPPLADVTPLLIIHGLFGSKRNWDSLSKAFSRSGRKVITVDARNHGDSPHCDEMDYHVMSKDIEQLMSDLQLEKANIIGHSMGGKIAMMLALNKPHLIDKLIIEDVSPDVSRSLETSMFPQYIEELKKIKFDDSKSIIANRRMADDQLKEMFPEKGVRSFLLMNIDQTEEGYRWKVNLDGIYGNLEQLIAFPDVQRCYEKETLFIGGKLSQHISESSMPNIKRFFPYHQIIHIDGAGHWVHSEKPVEFMNVVNKFLSKES